MGDNQLLKHVPIFADLADDEQEKISRIIVYRKYRKGMIIFMEGEPGDELYFVKEGRVKLAKLLEDGREQILHFVQKGEVFAEILLFDGGSFPATSEVMEDAEIGIIRNTDLDKLLREYPDIAIKLLKVMSKRLRRAQLQIRDLALKDTFGRMASTLLKLAGEYGVVKDGVVIIDFSLSQQELANLIGSSRETVARILSDFKRQKLISVTRQKISILNKKGLLEWSER
ncbi:MAG: Crp/Fnr family transcriptional regulator [Clostridia bacterium]|nr:Crp/Fnr family transcriptional regulator [Clostridia bacterium]